MEASKEKKERMERFRKENDGSKKKREEGEH
jgi:hypothetical protein